MKRGVVSILLEAGRVREPKVRIGIECADAGRRVLNCLAERKHRGLTRARAATIDGCRLAAPGSQCEGVESGWRCRNGAVGRNKSGGQIDACRLERGLSQRLRIVEGPDGVV